MKKLPLMSIVLSFILFSFTGCSATGDKQASLLIIYIATTVISFCILLSYCFLMRKKNTWFLLLFSSVFIVNLGYLALSVSKSVDEALLANRIAYLGSVFLPLSMLVIITEVCNIKFGKPALAALVASSVFIFAVTATPGYLDIYYKQVSLSFVNGVTVLEKVYGPWHCIYLFYLLIYFSAMIISIIYATVKKKTDSNKHAIILLIAVLVNLGVWFIEQFIKIDFELLSLSYIISELFLISLTLMIQENESRTASAEKAPPEIAANEAQVICEESKKEEAAPEDHEFSLRCQHFIQQTKSLTPTETDIFNCYLSGMGTKEVLGKLGIKENTLKYHNKNIYGKLGVTSRKELIKIAEAVSISEIRY